MSAAEWVSCLRCGAHRAVEQKAVPCTLCGESGYQLFGVPAEPTDTPYYLSDATVREVRGAPLGRMSSFDGALDTAMWVFDTARLDALCAAVARVAEARGRADAATGGTMNEVRSAVERGSDYCHDSTRWFEKEGVWDTYFAPIFNVMPESP